MYCSLREYKSSNYNQKEMLCNCSEEEISMFWQQSLFTVIQGIQSMILKWQINSTEIYLGLLVPKAKP